MKSKILTSLSSLVCATTIRDLSQELTDRRGAMEKELNEKANEITERYLTLEAQVVAEVEVEWHKLCAELSIPDGERATWYLHAAFLREHGLAFVIFDEEKAQHLAMIQSRLIESRHKH